MEEKTMSVLVSGVLKKSIADKKGIKPGDVLISVNSHEINDVLDYRFYIKEPTSQEFPSFSAAM